MSAITNVASLPVHIVGRVGRRSFMLLSVMRKGLEHLSGMWSLFAREQRVDQSDEGQRETQS